MVKLLAVTQRGCYGCGDDVAMVTGGEVAMVRGSEVWGEEADVLSLT